MKRVSAFSDEMDTSNSPNSMASGIHLHTPKKFKPEQRVECTDFMMDLESNSELAVQIPDRRCITSGTHNLVERDHKPMDYSLVNPDHVGKHTYDEMVELDACSLNMRFLQENIRKPYEEAQRDKKLHSAACNFVKKSGQTYHLYQRPSAQQYFSMLSPQDWNGNPPHAYLGSWCLEANKTWTSAEEMNLRFGGAAFLKNLYS
ncbi:uncharacterized protein C1orf50 homolog isoform X3 [Dendroctonus ponderosae]|uniref:Uncharacterized protein n=1 Tax=Dendroctonus ponderosae TaxID=77166 RepID=U4UYD2_DENPD|nr:uncharacterized protein C1orf50 homolog isoform X3 [Dendroctonus ponderosae]ERL95376.1 hypothetical protein D910_12640 [Dendroctonus ponderosae]KAH1014336.1 hypothetical protein HUJ04_003185 [Dendroctonus ponderosae]KAH1023758.1 hypothetical protein HUJ05_003361 [Dendroctonus ponderosae]